jgi:hypothetical protein
MDGSDITLASLCLKIKDMEDWQKAHDEYKAVIEGQDFIYPLCGVCVHSCKKMFSEYDQRGCGKFKQKIYAALVEQELEAGLISGFGGGWYIDDGDGWFSVCTRIFLPALKYKEYGGKLRDDVEFNNDNLKFHDIPVYSWPENHIHYCTD